MLRIRGRHLIINLMRSVSTFSKVCEKPNFPGQEEEILKYWEEINAFHRSLEMNKGNPKYTFYDGPPFATGLPHHGHIAAGTIKDVVTRYAHQNGFDVERRFGWDCHGLPIEFEIDKAYNIKTKKEVLELGIAEYNSRCKNIVMRYSNEWRSIVGRLGRWIDFDNDYKTMDLNFMESVWWSFKQLFNKGLVYRSSRVMPFSCGCNTVLSNFEANSNYQDVQDKSVIATFPLITMENTSVLAWTTTPWTLPTNFALAMHPQFTYVKFKAKDSENSYIVLEELLPSILKMLNIKQHVVEQKFKGSELKGLEYVPLFNHYEHMRASGCFRVYNAEFVTKESGTGIVHCAPYGEDDFNLFTREGIVSSENPPDPLDENGIFTSAIPELSGQYFKVANETIEKLLKERKRIIYIGTHNHSYPFCWRSNTPLIYRPVKSWFIKVEQLKEDLLRNNKDARWVPQFVQDKRFHNWLSDARDWCFSRSRFWGNPIPLWVSDDFEEVVCVGSIQELKELSGVSEITDLHREFIDHITIPSKQGKGVLRRIEEVFDCWYESGAMPYAQCHYPFTTNEEEFNKRFPADFIAEGLDQTRGWFYTLLVLGTGLFNKNPFKNLIVNGLVLDKDGKKLSKSKKNFTDPMILVNELGADSLRLYLMNSPVVRSEPLRFKDEGVRAIIKEVFLPWFNCYRFFVQNAGRYETATNQSYKFDPESLNKSNNFMDRWIIASCQNLIKSVRHEMENYKLYAVLPLLLKFLDNLTNWYVKLNRRRIKGENGNEDGKIALDVLFDTLLNMNILIAPFVPFLTENIYRNLSNGLPDGHPSKQSSIHFVMIPNYNPSLINLEIEQAVHSMQSIIEVGRKLRDIRKISLKTPTLDIKLIHRNPEFFESLRPIIKFINEELNTFEVIFEQENPETVLLSALPNNQVLGTRFQKTFGAIRGAISKLTTEEILTFERTKTIEILGNQLGESDLTVNRKYKLEGLDFVAGGNDDFILVLNTVMNPQLLQAGAARELVNHVQKLRKSSGLNVDDEIVLFYEPAGEYYSKILTENFGLVETGLKIPILPIGEKTEASRVINHGEIQRDEEVFKYVLCWKN